VTAGAGWCSNVLRVYVELAGAEAGAANRTTSFPVPPHFLQAVLLIIKVHCFWIVKPGCGKQIMNVGKN
jgi:hypothetical protein